MENLRRMLSSTGDSSLYGWLKDGDVHAITFDANDGAYVALPGSDHIKVNENNKL